MVTFHNRDVAEITRQDVIQWSNTVKYCSRSVTTHLSFSAVFHTWSLSVEMFPFFRSETVASHSSHYSQSSLLLPVFILDNSIHNFPHLLCEGRRIWGEFLSRRSSPLPLPLPIFIFVPSPSSPRGRGGAREVQVTVPLPLPGCLFVTYLFLHLFQRALLDRLHGKDTDSQITIKLFYLFCLFIYFFYLTSTATQHCPIPMRRITLSHCFSVRESL